MITFLKNIVPFNLRICVNRILLGHFAFFVTRIQVFFFKH